MKVKRRYTQQVSDLFAYLLVPGFAVCVPAVFSRWILGWVSNWRWLMAGPAEAAYQGARRYLRITDEVAWKSRWKQMELLDVRDLYMMMCGRSCAVLAETECSAPLEIAKDRVMIGMHWGPSISILKLLQTAGLNPALPYRPPESLLLRQRPFFYLFSLIATRYMKKTMRERAIAIGGAGTRLRAMLDQPGSVFVVMDAPPMEGRPTLSSKVLGRNACFNAGFPEILAARGKEYVFYAMTLCTDGSLRKKLELKGPYHSDSAAAFLAKYARHLDQHLVADSAHWRIWHVAGQFWRDEAPSAGEPQ